jgi:hypothetical protein
MGIAQSPGTRRVLERYVAAARSAIGDDAFKWAWAEGRAMALDQVIRELLEV